MASQQAHYGASLGSMAPVMPPMGVENAGTMGRRQLDVARPQLPVGNLPMPEAPPPPRWANRPPPSTMWEGRQPAIGPAAMPQPGAGPQPGVGLDLDQMFEGGPPPLVPSAPRRQRSSQMSPRERRKVEKKATERIAARREEKKSRLQMRKGFRSRQAMTELMENAARGGGEPGYMGTAMMFGPQAAAAREQARAQGLMGQGQLFQGQAAMQEAENRRRMMEDPRAWARQQLAQMSPPGPAATAEEQNRYRQLEREAWGEDVETTENLQDLRGMPTQAAWNLARQESPDDPLGWLLSKGYTEEQINLPPVKKQVGGEPKGAAPIP